MNQSVLDDYDKSMFGGNSFFDVGRSSHDFIRERQRSEMDFKKHKQIRDKAAKDRIILALTQREQNNRIKIVK